MKKNTASQVIGAQMVSASDGSAFTGSVTVYVTGDGGTQAAGSVGSGACTHEGNGFHSYAPAQAETNYDHIGFTFVGSGAVPVTVQVYTTYPQTGDNFARLGAPAGASVSADVAAVKAVLPAALVSGRMDASVGAMAAGVLTATAIAGDAITAAKVASDVTTEIQSGLATASAVSSVAGDVTAIKAKTDNLPSDPADASDVAAAFSTVNSNLATIAGYIDTEVGAIKAKTDNLPASPAATSDIPSASTVAAAVMGSTIEGSITMTKAVRASLAALGGKASGMETSTATFRDTSDSKDRIVATVDAHGNRSAVTLDLD